MENLSLVLYDDPLWFDEMVTTIADCILGILENILSTGGKFEAVSMWEDMAYNRGPLMSPIHFKKFLMPHYRRIADLVHKYGVDVIYLDCDGKIDALIPLWLEVLESTACIRLKWALGEGIRWHFAKNMARTCC